MANDRTADRTREEFWLGNKGEVEVAERETECSNKYFTVKNWDSSHFQFGCWNWSFTHALARSLSLSLALLSLRCSRSRCCASLDVKPRQRHRLALNASGLHSRGTSGGIMSGTIRKREGFSWYSAADSANVQPIDLLTPPRGASRYSPSADGPSTLMRCDILRSGFSRGESGRREATAVTPVRLKPRLPVQTHFFLDIYCWFSRPLFAPWQAGFWRIGAWANTPREDNQGLYRTFSGWLPVCEEGRRERFRVKGGEEKNEKTQWQHFAPSNKKKAGFQPRAIQAFVSAEILQVSANLRGLDVVWSICRLFFFNRKANFWHQSPEAHGSSDSKLWRFVLQHRCCFCWNRDLFFSWHAHTEKFLSLTGISDCLMSCMQKPKSQNCFPKKTKAMFYNLVSESNTKRICRAAVRSCKRFKVSLRLKLWQWATIYLIFPPVRPGWAKK